MKIKIAFICYYSNKELRSILKQRIPWWEKLGRKLMHATPPILSDHGIWNVNAIKEFEKFDDLEVHVITPQKFINRDDFCFELRGVYYHIFRDEDSYFSSRLKRLLHIEKRGEYLKNRKYIKFTIDSIHPQIVHLVGAENTFYSQSLFDIPRKLPTILQLQTLLNDPIFYKGYYMSKDNYNYSAGIERKLLFTATYIATRAEKYKRIIKENINPNVQFLDFSLALNEPVDLEERKIEYDFVYFAKSLAKAIDYAIESFAIAYKQYPHITLDVVGGCPPALMDEILDRIKELGIEQAVKFEGELPTHDDVIRQIRKARYALLPVKISLTTGTIREAMANGLPVITTDTGELGTQKLNSEKECVLLSPKGDHEAMAQNMILLMNDKEIFEKLKKNAGERASAMRSNSRIVNEWHDSYLRILQRDF
jgi:glycosyltransferase involved in cell wall biosynthesis